MVQDYSLYLILILGLNNFCVTDAMINEASIDGDKGMIAVGHLLRTRKDNRNFPSTYCQVLYQPSNNRRKPDRCAFSYTCKYNKEGEMIPTVVPKEYVSEYLRVSEIAQKIIDNKISNPFPGADHYLRCEKRRKWLKGMDFIGRIKSHCYYREKPRR